MVFLLEADHEKDNSSLENVRTMLGGKNGDFITAVDEKSIIVVKELAPSDGYPEMERTARQILESLGSGKKDVAHVAYGTIVDEIKRGIPFLQGSQNGPGCRKDFLCREKCDCVQLSWHRPSDLSASDSAV